MTIELIKEDGTGKSDANSYTDVAFVRFFALNRGFELDEDDEVVKAQIIETTEYLQSRECEFQGSRTFSEQALAFPRSGVKLYGQYLPSNVVPMSLQNAQAQAVISLSEGFELLPTIGPDSYVTSEKIGPLAFTYSNPAQVGVETKFSALEAFLKPLFGSCDDQKFSLRSMRV